jgi:hypothetical protein
MRTLGFCNVATSWSSEAGPDSVIFSNQAERRSGSLWTSVRSAEILADNPG